MSTVSGIEKRTIAPSLIQYLESKARLTGLIREIYVARGWIKQTGYDTEPHYQVTPKGLRVFNDPRFYHQN